LENPEEFSMFYLVRFPIQSCFYWRLDWCYRAIGYSLKVQNALAFPITANFEYIKINQINYAIF
jgi:hypothetical protein